MHDVDGCGEQVHEIARKELFSILGHYVEKLKSSSSESEINQILNVFYWSYKAADLPYLA